ncbi:unnamed protein product [Thelazia callipaeda]|uniref:Zf-RVT domain-containing protein n=1 Tax=Thelazia callipaeda TaxID=103827 RepID=A0A0N5D378_THECL|nr:unnamed protein product [Thelazia callipaeda]
MRWISAVPNANSWFVSGCRPLRNCSPSLFPLTSEQTAKILMRAKYKFKFAFNDIQGFMYIWDYIELRNSSFRGVCIMYGYLPFIARMSVKFLWSQSRMKLEFSRKVESFQHWKIYERVCGCGRLVKEILIMQISACGRKGNAVDDSKESE